MTRRMLVLLGIAIALSVITGIMWWPRPVPHVEPPRFGQLRSAQPAPEPRRNQPFDQIPKPESIDLRPLELIAIDVLKT